MNPNLHFQTLARYNRWATERLLHALAPLIAAWDPARFDGSLDYTALRGTRHALPFAATLAHVFNHGTHHRGQISAALTAMGHPAPELDMVYMLQADTPHTA